MKISDYPEVEALNEDDLLVISRPGQGTKSVSIRALAQLLAAGVGNAVANNLNVTEEGYILDARQGKVLGDRFNYSTEEKVVGKWINGAPIYKRTIPIKQRITSTTTFDMSSWYKCPVLNPTDGMMMIRTEPFWQWDGDGNSVSRGSGTGCQMVSQSWVDYTRNYAIDIFFNGQTNTLNVRTQNCLAYLIAVTCWYYKLNEGV